MADQEKAKSGSGVGVGALAGGIAGAFIAGSVLAALAMMFLAKKKKKSHVSTNPLVLHHSYSLRLPVARADLI
jgi:hypothetical protein